MTSLTREIHADAQALLEKVLRGGESLAPEYPLVFGPGERAGWITSVEVDGEPIAGCACLPRVLLVDGVHMPVGLIGSVATDPDHRGQGHGTAVLERAERELAEAGCAFGLLWADDASWYEARGWSPMGAEADFVLPVEAAPLLPATTGVRPAGPGDVDALHAIYLGHGTRVERSAEETATLLRIPRMETLVLERDGVPCAYACCGRGIDLANVVHEWGGASVDVLALVRAHLERAAAPLVLFAPMDARPMFRYMHVLDLPAHVGPLGMGKLISPAAAARVLREACSGVDVEASESGVVVRGPAGEACLDATQTLLLLAAPRGLRELVQAVEELTGRELPNLPLEPFCWGLDSI